MVDYDHPANGEQPWGDKNTANHELSGIHIDALEAVVYGDGTAENPHTDPAADRNDLLVKNFWQCSTEPTNWLDGDEWIMTP